MRAFTCPWLLERSCTELHQTTSDYRGPYVAHHQSLSLLPASFSFSITLILVNQLPHLARSTITWTCPVAFYKMLSKDGAAITTSILRNRETERAALKASIAGERAKKEKIEADGQKGRADKPERADAFLWELITPLPQKRRLAWCPQTYQKASLKASYTAI